MTKEKFKDKVWDIAEEISIKPLEIHIREMKQKWSSCSSKGRLSFSSELLTQPWEFQLEAIIHELLHLKYPTHGKMFKIMLKAYKEKLTGKFCER